MFYFPGMKKVCWTLLLREKSLFRGLTILALPFKLLKPQFIGRILQNKSPYLNFNYCFIGGTLKNIWSFTLYLEAGETELIHYEIRALYRCTELGPKCLELAPTLKYGLLNSSVTVFSIWVIKILQCYASKHL